MVDGHEAKARLKLNVSGIKLNKTERNWHGLQCWAAGQTPIVLSLYLFYHQIVDYIELRDVSRWCGWKTEQNRHVFQFCPTVEPTQGPRAGCRPPVGWL